MARNQGTFNFAANFEGTAKAPIDARQVVGTYADLTNTSTWNQSGNVWLFDGAMVAVANDPDSSKNGIYFLKDGTGYTSTSNWVQLATAEATSGDTTYNAVWMSGETETGGTLKTWYDVTQSAGRISGGTITDGGAGTVNISAGAGLIKDGTGRTDQNRYVTWGAVSNLALSTGYNFIYYDAENNQITSTTNEAEIRQNNNFNIGRVYRDGSTVIIRLCGQNLWNLNRRLHLYGDEVYGVQRASGMVASSVSGLTLQVTGGALWAELLNRFTTEDFDSITDNFSEWSYTSGSWSAATVTDGDIDNTVWNNQSGGTLDALTTSYYTLRWVYVVHDSSVHVVYGDAEYSGLTEALNASAPATLPELVQGFGTLVARVVVQQGNNTLVEIDSAFNQVFSTQSVQAHNELSGIQGGQAGEYNHLTDAQVVDVNDIPNIQDDITGLTATKLDITDFDTYTGDTDTRLGDIEEVTGVAVTGATNGVCKYGTHDVCLGGTLTTDLSLSMGTNDIYLTSTYNSLRILQGATINELRSDITRSGSDYAGYFRNAVGDGSADIRLFARNTVTTECGDVWVCDDGISMKYKESGGTCQSTVMGCTGMFVTDTINQKGLEYAGAYRTNFTPLSLVDKCYVDTCVAGIEGGAITGATNGLGTDGQDVCLGAALTKNTSITADFDLCLGTAASNLNTLQVFTDNGITLDSDQNITISVSGGTITTDDNLGLRYSGAYESSFVDASLVSKCYVDTVATGLQPHDTVLVATTADITLSGTQTIDGVSVIAGDRVLVKDQTTGADNGIYVVAAGAWARAEDFDGTPVGEVVNGDLVPVESGSTQANTIWVLTTPDPITVGTTPLDFTLFSRLLGVSAGDGIEITPVGSTQEIAVDLAANGGLCINATELQVDDAIAGNGLTWNTGVLDVNAAGTAIGNELGIDINAGDCLVLGSAQITQDNLVAAAGGTILGNGITFKYNGLNQLVVDSTSITTDNAVAAGGGTILGNGITLKYNGLDELVVDSNDIQAQMTGNTFTNGLCEVSGEVCLGGDLTENTYISTTGTYGFCLDNGGGTGLCIDADGQPILGNIDESSLYFCLGPTNGGVFNANPLNIVTDNANISTDNGIHIFADSSEEVEIGAIDSGVLCLTAAGNVFTDNTISNEGIVYAGDYESTFADRSLVTKQYVASQVSGITNAAITGATNGLGTDGQEVCLGGTLSKDTVIDTANLYGLAIGCGATATGNNAIAFGCGATASGNNSFAVGTDGGNYGGPEAIGVGSIALTSADGNGNSCVTGDYSALISGRRGCIIGSTHSVVLGGFSNCLATGNDCTVILGGDNIAVTAAALPNHAIVPSLAIWDTPDDDNDGAILVWDSSTKKVGKTTMGALGGLTGATNGVCVSGQDIVLGGALTGNTIIDTQNAYGLALGDDTTNIVASNNSLALGSINAGDTDISITAGDSGGYGNSALAFGHGYNGGFAGEMKLCSTGTGSMAFGQVGRYVSGTSVTEIWADDSGTMAFGSAGQGGKIRACRVGVQAFGYASWNGQICGEGFGTVTFGEAYGSYGDGTYNNTPGGLLHGDGTGTITFGYALNENSRVCGDGIAGLTAGYAKTGGMVCNRSWGGATIGDAFGATEVHFAGGYGVVALGGRNNCVNVDYSAILAGRNNVFTNSANVNSVVLGGTGITVTTTGYNEHAIVPSLAIWTTPSTGAATDDVLVWNNTDKKVKKISASSLGEDNNIYAMSVITSDTTLTTGSTYVQLVNSPTSGVTVTLPATPINGQVFRIKDAASAALSYPVTVAGNGNEIDNGSNPASLNTDGGALEIVWNQSLNSWYVFSFVN
jgi:hypothetical protein